MIAIDTSILVYASDLGAGEKYLVAKALLTRAMSEGKLLLPLKVLSEFAHIAVRKAKHTPHIVETWVLAWSAVAQVEGYRLDDVRAALRARAEHSLVLGCADLGSV